MLLLLKSFCCCYLLTLCRHLHSFRDLYIHGTPLHLHATPLLHDPRRQLQNSSKTTSGSQRSNSKRKSEHLRGNDIALIGDKTELIQAQQTIQSNDINTKTFIKTNKREKGTCFYKKKHQATLEDQSRDIIKQLQATLKTSFIQNNLIGLVTFQSIVT